MAQQGKDKKSDKDVIQGVWSVESVVDDGLSMPPEFLDQVKFHVTGDKIEIKIGELSIKADYTVDETKTPKTVDLKLDDGSSMIGIYEMQGEKFKFCMTDSKSGSRPKEFKSEAGSQSKLVVLFRAKEDKKTDDKKTDDKKKLEALAAQWLPLFEPTPAFISSSVNRRP